MNQSLDLISPNLIQSFTLPPFPNFLLIVPQTFIILKKTGNLFISKLPMLLFFHGKRCKVGDKERIGDGRVKNCLIEKDSKVQTGPFSSGDCLFILGAWKIIEGIVSFGELLIRNFIFICIVLQSDARVTAPPRHLSSQSWILCQDLVICYTFFQKLIGLYQRSHTEVYPSQLRQGTLVVFIIGRSLRLEVCDNSGKGLKVFFHLLMMGATLGGLTCPYESGHCPKDSPEFSLLFCYEFIGMKIDEEKIALLLFLGPVTGLGKYTRISTSVQNICLFSDGLRLELSRFLLYFDLFEGLGHFLGVNYIDNISDGKIKIKVQLFIKQIYCMFNSGVKLRQFYAKRRKRMVESNIYEKWTFKKIQG